MIVAQALYAKLFSPAMRCNFSSNCSLTPSIAFRSTGMTDFALLDANVFAKGPVVENQRELKSQPDSAADAILEKSWLRFSVEEVLI